MRMTVLLGLISLALLYGAFGAGALMSDGEDWPQAVFQSALAPELSSAPPMAGATSATMPKTRPPSP